MDSEMQRNSEIESRLLAEKSLDHFGAILEEFSIILSEKPYVENKFAKSFLESLESLVSKFQNYKNGIAMVEVLMRKVRDEEAHKYEKGEDPGIWMKITLKNDTQINVNVHGGLRRISELDSRQTINQTTRRESSTAMTDRALGQRSEININVIQQGMVVNDVWIALTPVFTPKERKSHSITTYIDNTNGIVNPEGLLPLNFVESYSADATRKLIDEIASKR